MFKGTIMRPVLYAALEFTILSCATVDCRSDIKSRDESVLLKFALVSGKVTAVDPRADSTIVKFANVKIVEIYSSGFEELKLGDQFQIMTATLSGPRQGSDWALATPELSIGDIGVFAVYSSKYEGIVPYSHGAYGRDWPSTPAGDRNYEAVVAWAAEHKGNDERRRDFRGKQWPAPLEHFKTKAEHLLLNDRSSEVEVNKEKSDPQSDPQMDPEGEPDKWKFGIPAIAAVLIVCLVLLVIYAKRR